MTTMEVPLEQMSHGFWRDLNDDYYKTFPERWEQGDLYADGPDFVAILEGETNIFRRRLAPDETVVYDGIVRAGRKIWEVGRVYSVRAEPWKEPTLGKIKLVSIVDDESKYWVIMNFEMEK